MPGYPYVLYGLLSLTGSYAATAIVQLVLGALIPVIGMQFARVLVPSLSRAPLVIGALLALAPYQVLFSFIFYTETMFTFTFGIFFLAFFRYLRTPSMRLAMLSGFLLGLVTLIKPTVQYVPVVVGAFMVWRFRKTLDRKLFIQLGSFVVVFVFVLIPWLYRNYTTFGVANLSSQMPFNLYGTLLPSVLAIANHTSFAVEQAKLPVFLDSDLSSLSSLSGKAIAEISRHPVALIELSALNALTFFTHDGMLTFLQAAGINPISYLQKPALLLLITAPWQFAQTIWEYMHTNMAFVFFARLFWITVTILFLLGLYRLLRAKLFSPELLFSVIVVFYFMLTTMVNGLSVNARFRMPVEPIIFAVAYAGLVLTRERTSKNLPHEH